MCMNFAYSVWAALAFAAAPAAMVSAVEPAPEGAVQAARATMQEAVKLLEDLNSILNTVSGRATADAAAMPMIGNLTQYASVIENLDVNVDVLDPAQQRALEKDYEAQFYELKSAVYEKIQALDAAGAYGSAALQSAISQYRQLYK